MCYAGYPDRKCINRETLPLIHESLMKQNHSCTLSVRVGNAGKLSVSSRIALFKSHLLEQSSFFPFSQNSKPVIVWKKFSFFLSHVNLTGILFHTPTVGNEGVVLSSESICTMHCGFVKCI